jgi:anti-anti-sigma factor
VAAVSSVAEWPSALTVSQRTDDSISVLIAGGDLDGGSAVTLCESIVAAARAEPTAVVVDVTAVRADAPSAWASLIDAHWQVCHRNEVPVVLVCAHRASRDAIARHGLATFMPVFTTEKAARKALGGFAPRTARHVDVELPADLSSLRESRRLVREWLTVWTRPKLIPVALVVVNVFVENVLEHTPSIPKVRVETDGATATIAVSDRSKSPARRLAAPAHGTDVSGLAIVDALSRAWGSTPTPGGKTVWAVIGPENQL